MLEGVAVNVLQTFFLITHIKPHTFLNLFLVIIINKEVRSMIPIPGSLSFAKLVMMSSAPAKPAGDARNVSQDPFIQSTLSHTISTPICLRSAFSLHRTQEHRLEMGDQQIADNHA